MIKIRGIGLFPEPRRCKLLRLPVAYDYHLSPGWRISKHRDRANKKHRLLAGSRLKNTNGMCGEGGG